jgi:6-phosphogluconolactonase
VSDVEIVVADDPTEATAQHVVDAVRAGGHIALSGGGTPGPAYTRAAQLEPDWSRVELWWVDDRCVPPDHPDSNYRLVGETLLSHLRVQPRAVHRIHGEHPPKEAAARYDGDLQGVILDLAIMGIGPDGHTASLFPGAPELDERARLAVAAEPGWEPFVPRVTMTIPALALSRLMVYLVTGADKAGPVDRAFRRPPSPRTPASLVRGRRTVAVLDAAAAGG